MKFFSRKITAGNAATSALQIPTLDDTGAGADSPNTAQVSDGFEGNTGNPAFVPYAISPDSPVPAAPPNAATADITPAAVPSAPQATQAELLAHATALLEASMPTMVACINRRWSQLFRVNDAYAQRINDALTTHNAAHELAPAMVKSFAPPALLVDLAALPDTRPELAAILFTKAPTILYEVSGFTVRMPYDERYAPKRREVNHLPDATDSALLDGYIAAIVPRHFGGPTKDDRWLHHRVGLLRGLKAAELRCLIDFLKDESGMGAAYCRQQTRFTARVERWLGTSGAQMEFKQACGIQCDA